jgi:hypothetical protein
MSASPIKFLYGWYSARCASHVGFDVYHRPGWDAVVSYVDGQGVVPTPPDMRDAVRHVTHVTDSPEKYSDWGDEIFIGMVRADELIRHVEARQK